MSGLADLFPPGDYRHHLTLRRAEPNDFFLTQDPSGRLLAERVRWVEGEPDRYAQLLPDGRPLLEELSKLVVGWGGPALPEATALAGRLEPDVLLLSPDEHGRFRLRGGALCFPTGWALEEKIGHTLDFIHEVVPGLNAALGDPIQQFLARLKPGMAYCRDNWGLAATEELNLHPARRIRPPEMPVSLEKLWLRVEHQALVALPVSGGVTFGIRIALHRLDRVRDDRLACHGLRQALQTMSREMASYKRVEAVRAEVIRLLNHP